MATTYVPTTGIHAEELPTVTSAADSDGMIINSGNKTLSQIPVSNLMSGVQSQIDELNTDLNVKTYTTISSLGLSVPCTTAEIVNAMAAMGNGLEYWGGVTRSSSSITDLPCAGGVLHVYIASASRVAIEVFRAAASGNTYPAQHYYGAMDSDWSAVVWYQATTSEVSTTALNAIEPLNDGVAGA